MKHPSKKLKMVSPFPKDVYEHNAGIYKLMANAKRLEILNILSLQPATLSELSEVVGASKSNISQHLSILRHLNLVMVMKRSSEVFYGIVDPNIVASCRVMKDLWNAEGHHPFRIHPVA